MKFKKIPVGTFLSSVTMEADVKSVARGPSGASDRNITETSLFIYYKLIGS